MQIQNTLPANAIVGDSVFSLKDIHQKDKNIAIYERSTDHLQTAIEQLLKLDLKIKLEGSVEDLNQAIDRSFQAHGLNCLSILEDLKYCLKIFSEISGSDSYRLLLATVNNNMCRRFHTDVNDLRLLCTYSGQATLWLADSALSRAFLEAEGAVEPDPQWIQQAQTGDILILKGALYPNAKAVVHRSPSIEGSGEKRLLLRIDTQEFLNLYT